MSSFEESYLGQLRKLVGGRRLITPGVHGIIVDDDDQIFLVRRRDNGLWTVPGGGLELNESVYDCLVREVREEAGLTVLKARLTAIYSGPEFSGTNMFGSEYQMLQLGFHVSEWTGTPIKETDETTDSGFFDVNNLPPMSSPRYPEVFDDFLSYDGTVILK